MTHRMIRRLPYLTVLIAAGCSSVSQPSVTRLPNGDGRPPFYEAHNTGQFYAHCPKCNSWTKGSVIASLSASSDGKMSCEETYQADCPECGAHLNSSEFLVDDRRIITWHTKP